MHVKHADRSETCALEASLLTKTWLGHLAKQDRALTGQFACLLGLSQPWPFWVETYFPLEERSYQVRPNLLPEGKSHWHGLAFHLPSTGILLISSAKPKVLSSYLSYFHLCFTGLPFISYVSILEFTVLG